MTADAGQDPVVRRFREQITEADTAILEAVNRRVGLVQSLHRHKTEHGYPMVDSSREQALLAELGRRNPGPLSGDGLELLFRTVIEISKREAAGTGDES
jgi:chorismate mutase